MQQCVVFGDCGGCAYQDIPYKEELKIKEDNLKEILRVEDDLFQPIVPSPKIYHYRHRLDLKMIKTKDKGNFMGFSPQKGYPFGVVDVETCPIAMHAINKNLKKIRQDGFELMGTKYHRASLVVRTGDEGRVEWGGIGKGSLRRRADQYLWTKIGRQKVFYGMDTFFQANLSILPDLFSVLRGYPLWGQETCFYDLYGGVGLFGIGLADLVGKVILVEENKASIECAEYNKAYNKIDHMDLYGGRMEDVWIDFNLKGFTKHVAMIDPPRDGLSEEASEALATNIVFNDILYLSCFPEALARDLKIFKQFGWKVEKVTPFDFFPRTRHVETLVWLTKG